jgi:hypothetical protein
MACVAAPIRLTIGERSPMCSPGPRRLLWRNWSRPRESASIAAWPAMACILGPAMTPSNPADAEAMGKAGARRIRQLVPPDPIRVFSEKLRAIVERAVA